MPVLNGQADGQVVINIAANNQNAVNTIQNTVTQAQNAGRQIENNVRTTAQNSENSIAKSLKGIVGAISAAGIAKKILDIGKAAVQAASDLEEVQNVVDTTFGASSGKIDAWAKNAIKQYGLTETKAKKFASTIGSTLKSMGVEGNQLLDVSESLAGLAADMASFYNLDFDTAFEKLRSGLIGQAEPLKALGINMSAANLQAFALSKGIQTAVDKMSASEQAMLRYEYIMQATSDAQGDFARTSDGMANGLRLLDSQIETLKTNLGGPFLTTVSGAIGYINDMLALLIPEEKPRTILDDFAEIDLQTDAKIKKIEETATNARTVLGLLTQIEAADPDAANIVTFADEISGAADNIVEALGEIEGADKKIDQLDDFTLSSDQLTQFSQGIAGGITQIAEAINGIDPEKVTSFDGVADTVETLGNAKDISSAAAGVSTISNAVGKNNLTKTKSEAWKQLLDSLSSNANGISALTTQSGQGAAEFLKGLSEEAATLSETDVNSWERLFGLLTQELPQAEDTEEGQTFSGLLTDKMSQEAGAVQSATNYLEAYNLASNTTAENQALWLEGTKQLVKDIPTLSSVIDTQTGRVQANMEVVGAYIDEWETMQKKMAEVEGLKQKQAIYEGYDLAPYQMAAYVARAEADRAKQEWQDYRKSLNLNASDFTQLESYLRQYKIQRAQQGSATGAGAVISKLMADTAGLMKQASSWFTAFDYNAVIEQYEAYLQLEDEAAKKEQEYVNKKDAVATATEKIAAEQADLNDEIKEYESLLGVYSQEQIDAWNEQLTLATELSQAVSDYYQNTRDEMLKTVQTVVSGFDKMQTPAQKAIADVAELGDVTDDVKDKYRQNIPTISNMLESLQSQLDYMDEYQKMLTQAKAMGVSSDILAFLSDGSQESYDYLAAITGKYYDSVDTRLAAATPKQIEQLNQKYADVQKGQEGFADSLTQTKLTADEAFQGIVKAAGNAIDGIDLQEQATNSMAKTVQGIADGIAQQIPAVQAQIDALTNVLYSLSDVGIILDWSGGINGDFELSWGTKNDGTFASGLDYVPYDGFLAQLHQGESILTAEESAAWRAMRVNAGNKQAGFDYGTLASSVWDGAPAMGGGNVYLDGQTVGRVISARQADTYRALTRSGWQQ